MSPRTEVQAQIIIALDFPTLRKAKDFVRKVDASKFLFKVGLELITLGKARELIRFIYERGGQVFYDGKFDDIPNTTGASSKIVARMPGVKMFNVHASSGRDSIIAAVKNKGPGQLVLGVTILTSILEESVPIFGEIAEDKVLLFAYMLLDNGADGVICSPHELRRLGKHAALDNLIKVTPGIRDSNAPPDDQNRTMTAEEAVLAGAHYLVIGRPITQANNPALAAELFMKRISSVS